MRVLKTSREIKDFLVLLRQRASGGGAKIEETVKKILADVRKNGDQAVIAYTEKFDRVKKVKKLRMGAAEILRHANRADRKIVRSLELAARRIRTFHEMQKEDSWSFSQGDATLGQIVRPLQRVGVYIPGGKASYPSSVLMNVIPAQVAGVHEIAVCVPTPGNEVNPAVMAAIRMLGIKEVHRIGGAQAIAALAYGTKSVIRVDKIVGPGNIYVATAKKLVFGEVDIDMIAGPSEVLIIADKTAHPAFVAADLLSQAEHDEMASSILITDSAPLAHAVAHEVARQLPTLPRKSIARRSITEYGAIVHTKTIAEAVRIANEIAPEHLEVMTTEPRDILPAIRNAGAIFLGQWTPEPLGDYVAGPNHTLPTGGTARFFSPLGVYDFIKRSSLLSFSREGFRRLSQQVLAISGVEGLDAHGNAVRVRLESA